MVCFKLKLPTMRHQAQYSNRSLNFCCATDTVTDERNGFYAENFTAKIQKLSWFWLLFANISRINRNITRHVLFFICHDLRSWFHMYVRDFWNKNIFKKFTELTRFTHVFRRIRSTWKTSETKIIFLSLKTRWFEKP